MKYKCKNEECNNTVSNEVYYCKKCSNLREQQILKALELYLSESFQFKENYQASYPYKIVDHQRLKHGINIVGYSNRFIRMFNGCLYSGINTEDISKSITKLKKSNMKLYNSLTTLWGRPINKLSCHKSTVYRRLYKALKLIAEDIGLLKLI